MPSPILPHSASRFDSSVQWNSAAVRPVIELAKGRLKELRSTGHKVERFLTARGACARHAIKAGHERDALWLRGREEPPGAWSGEGLFSCAVLMREDGFALIEPVLPQDLTTRLAGLWQRCDADAPKSLPGALPIPVDANAPLWLALLRLRPLHGLWERELRRGTLESLLDLLPDAWVLDPTPFPPGAVIPRLELSSWKELSALASSGRRFLLASREEWDGAMVLDASVPRKEWETQIEEALQQFAKGPRVLVELPPQTEKPTWLIAFFEKKAGRVDGIGALGLASDDDGSLIPTRVVAA